MANEINLETLLNPKKNTDAIDKPVDKEIDFKQETMTFDEEDRKNIESIKDSIDILDTNAVIQFGNTAQNNISQFSNSVLEQVRTKDGGYVGELLQNLVGRLEEFDEDNKSGFLKKIPGVSKLFNSAQKMITKYNKLSTEMEKITAELEKNKIVLQKDIALFDELSNKNLEYFKNLNIYIKAGEEKTQELQQIVLPKIKQEAASSTNEMALQAVNDLENTINRFEKKVHDLKISRTIAMQTAPQIRLIQNNNKLLIDRVQNVIYNTIPLWKNQMILTIGIDRQTKVLEMNRAVSDMTNELLKGNAKLLKETSINTAKENERGIIDIETLKETNRDIIETIRQTIAIQQDGSKVRQQAEVELKTIETELKNTLLASMSKQQADK
ncbi:toxic anion resistance protein [Pectinatus brassicae]|uniref:Uncharacterized protein YaaN involved in tellurite resistance n=1 Tax=Pectinatus brassicae TaxID=862415 RepID=A0A840UUN5_9FIRM|nr:toxic anion resistance protein [Pectinatus brassicae]MBB5336524.1 uncharacterized protein YaaN involved in tellurite resistance [Pectinatus brassicae]